MTLTNSRSSTRSAVRRVRLNLIVIGAIAALSIVAVVAAYRIEFGARIAHNREYWGQFGDFVGGLLNPIFGFLAFVALLATLYYQRREYEEQRSFILRQQFEQTFFQLLDAFHKVLADVAFPYMDRRTRAGPNGIEVEEFLNSAKGREAFSFIWSRSIVPVYSALHAAQSHKDKVLQTAEKLYESQKEELGQYFRTLYHIFKFIDLSHLDLPEKVRYANIARAQLSSLELSVIFYNGVVQEGYRGFKPLIEKYGLLKHIEAKYLLGAHVGEDDRLLFYDRTAFMNFSDRLKEWKSVEPVLTYD